MDSLTHTVLGACLGEIIAGKKIGKKAMLIGALVNNLPDIDMLANFWSSTAEGLLTHRGLTHSIFFCAAITPVLIFLLKKIYPATNLSNKHWIVLVSHGLFLHILMDSFTTYGTGWFEPFSHYRVSFNTLFILDPFFMFPLLISFILLLVLKRERHGLREKISIVALSLSVFYLICTIVIKLHVNTVIKKEITRQKIEALDYMASPTPLNNVLWYAVVREKENYYVGHYSLFDKNPIIGFESIHKNDSLIAAYKINSDLNLLRRFSKNYYSIKSDTRGYLYSDLRFGQIGFMDSETKQFVFNFDLVSTSDTTVIVKQSKFKELSSGEIEALFKRIKGI